MDERNFTYMFYGFTVAWLVLAIYVVSLGAREKRLRDEMSRLRKMLER